MSARFYCPVCQTHVPLSYLDGSCLIKAHTNDPLVAVRRLQPDQLICQACQDALDNLNDGVSDLPRRGRDVDYYHARYPGDRLDRATIDWLRQNY